MDTASGNCLCLGRNRARRGHICSRLNYLAEITLEKNLSKRLLEKISFDNLKFNC